MATKGICKDLRRPPNRKVQAVEGQGSSAHPSKPSSFYGAWAFLLPQREGGAMSPREAPAPYSSSTGQRRERGERATARFATITGRASRQHARVLVPRCGRKMNDRASVLRGCATRMPPVLLRGAVQGDNNNNSSCCETSLMQRRYGVS